MPSSVGEAAEKRPFMSRRQMVLRKADLLDSQTRVPLRLRNKALLSLDGGGLRGILTGSLSSMLTMQTYAAAEGRSARHCLPYLR